MIMKKIIAFLVFFFLIIGGCSQQEPVKILRIGDNAPSFVLLDINGQKLSLADVQGKIVLIDFWATYCPPCRKSIPFLNELQKNYGGEEFTVLGLSMDGSTKNVTAFKKVTPIDYTVLMATEDVARKYNIRGIPTIYLLDKEGRIIYKTLFVNEPEKEHIKEKIEERLQGISKDV
jgi:thiol-disulfide isomerase/thioredoxin